MTSRVLRFRCLAVSLFALLPMVAPVSFAGEATKAAVHGHSVVALAESRDTRLLAAARGGDMAGAMSAVAEGANVDARDERGSTPLILASYYGHDALVKALLAAGASPNAGDAQRGNTALMGALFRGEDAVALILLDDPRTRVDQRNHAGQTAAMFAALFGRAAMIGALAARGADFTLADEQGETAEGLAHKQGNDALVEMLAKYPARH